MTTPGSNILRRAQFLLGKQTVNYFEQTTRQVNAVGLIAPSFEPPVALLCSVEPVQRNLYESLGLDFQKNYATIFITRNLIDLVQGKAGDRFGWNGRMWQVQSDMNWNGMDGWVSSISVDVGPDPNVYLKVPQYTDPGATEESNYTFSGVQFTGKNMVVVDVPFWQIGDGFYKTILVSGLVPGTPLGFNVAINQVQQGSITFNADPAGYVTDEYPTPFPGLNSYGVVAGGLRPQFNVRLTISCAIGFTGDIELGRGSAG